MDTDENIVFEKIYETCKEEFQEEHRRKQSLEGRESVYLSVYSAILGLWFVNSGFSSKMLESAIKQKNNVLFCVIIFLLLLLIIFYGVGSSLLLASMRLKAYRAYPNPEKIINLLNNKPIRIFYKSMAADFSKSINENEKINNQKVSHLSDSYKWMIAIFIILILLLCLSGYLKYMEVLSVL